jgi:hypothetical protein
MTFASDDFDRFVSNETRVLFPELRAIREGEGLVRDAVLSVRRHLKDGVRDRKEMQSLVAADLEEKYAGVVAIAILMAVVSFVVRRILEKIFPNDRSAL